MEIKKLEFCDELAKPRYISYHSNLAAHDENMHQVS